MTACKFSSDWADDDVDAFVDVCAVVEVYPLHLLACMFSESAAKAEAHNANGDATGLIQFMPQTQRNMGFLLGWQAFAGLGVSGQLPYVRRYLAPYRGKLTSAALCYCAVFLPAVLTWPGLNALTVITSLHGPFSFAYLPNKVFDRHGRGYITVGDLGEAVDRASRGDRWGELSGRVIAAMKARTTDPEIPITEMTRDRALDPDDPPIPLLPDPGDDG